MTNTYKHYGVDVIRQIVTSSFRRMLNKEGIQYIDLAISPNIDVVTYTVDGNKRYALIRPQSRPDDYAETIYITSQTPDDCNWDKLADDVDAQYEGEEPIKRLTRAKMLLGAAERAAYKELPESLGTVPDEDDLLSDMILYLAGHGISATDLLHSEHYDVDEGFLQKLVAKDK